MPLRRLTTAGTPVTMSDLAHALLASRADVRVFEAALASSLGARHAVCAGSATAAMYYILKAMKRLSADPARVEVVLPAYTAGAPVLAVRRAGLVPRLAEVSLSSFQTEPESFARAVTDRTLAVVPTDLFGIPVDTARLRAMLPPEVFVLEDAAQAMGSKLGGRAAGTMGDAGIVSFQRGKNMSTYAGGAALTDRDDIAEILARESGAAAWPGLTGRAAYAAKLALVSAVIHPRVYGMAHRLVSPLKSTTLHEEFETGAYTPFRAAVGMRLLARLEALSCERRGKGEHLMSALAGVKGITLPTLPDSAEAAFAQFPLLVADVSRTEPLRAAILRVGIETTRFYLKPLHRLVELGYDREPDPFPDATYLAEHLLLIPVHRYVGAPDLDAVVEAVKEAL